MVIEHDDDTLHFNHGFNTGTVDQLVGAAIVVRDFPEYIRSFEKYVIYEDGDLPDGKT